MEQLKQLEQKLIDAAKVKSEETEASMFAEAAFWEAVGESPELMALKESMDNSASRMKIAKDTYAETKKAAVKELLELTNPDDFTDIDAFNYRVEKKVWIDKAGTHLVERLADIEAYGLLQVNEKVLTAFIKINAVKGDDGYELPLWLEKQYEYMISVEDEIKPQNG
jgi:hypothetical protein